MFDKHKAAHAEAQHQAAIGAALTVANRAHEAMQAGRLNTATASVDGFMLKKGELATFIFRGVGLVEPRRTPGQWSGGSHGVSIHVAKGLNYRVGQSRGTYTQGEERPTVIDTGNFLVTDQRFIFAGSKRTIEWSYTKLVGFSLEQAGMSIFNVSNRQKASGVAYATAIDHIVDAVVAAAVARYQGTAQHAAVVAELEDEYRHAWNHWSALTTNTAAIGNG
jgi:hypothetical protein